MSLFDGFHLGNARSLRDLAMGLAYRLVGEPKLEDGHIPSVLTAIQRTTIGGLLERIQNSPLINEIIKAFLNIPWSDDVQLLAGGRWLYNYVRDSAEDPTSDGYRAMENAWAARNPLPAANLQVPRVPARGFGEQMAANRREERQREMMGQQDFAPGMGIDVNVSLFFFTYILFLESRMLIPILV